MIDTDTQAKAPPAWMERAPLDRAHVTTALDRMAAARVREASSTTDKDVREGLLHSAGIIARAALAVSTGHNNDALMEPLTDYANARLGCARTTTEPAARASYMDEAHAFREAVRYLDPR